MKQNASIDASFWINCSAMKVVRFVDDYFSLFASAVVAREIRYPLDVLGIRSATVTTFNAWVAAGQVKLQEPAQPVDWLQEGENAAIALAIENDYFLLIDDANAYHRAKAAGVKTVGSAEFVVFLVDQGRITFEAAADALKQTHASKKQVRLAQIALETLKRLKEG